MRYRNIKPLNELIQNAVGNIPTKQQDQNLVMQAWYEILPNTKDQLQHTFIKRKTLYIKPKSPNLKHQLNLEKTKIHLALNQALQHLDTTPNIVEQIFFI